MSPSNQLLPALRPELSYLPAPVGEDGAPRWFLFDPVRNSFHILTQKAANILLSWRAETPREALARIEKNHPELHPDEDLLKEMTTFLYQQNLTLEPPASQTDIYTRQITQSRKPLYERFFHKSLFLRIPLFQPHSFLKATAPYISFLFKPKSWVIIAAIGLIGLFFAARQWDQFLDTFIYFFTLEGFLFYALTLTLIKILHELGHAYTAHHFGARVPIMGLAFILLFPVLYTDTTDAWRLTSRRERALIDAGGMIVEIAIAALAIFLWSFLPDGPARSAAFFAATSSWLLSLMVNLNPFMRFDGYYLLSDLCGVENMQESGFALGRWKMRETLFGLGRPKPLNVKPRKETGLVIYAYLTWVYRVFLLTGIALIAYHILPKGLGVAFLMASISLFIISPIWREIQLWWTLRMTVLSTRRGRLTLTLSCAALIIFFYPWQNKITAPAVIQPSLQTEIYPMSAARIKVIHVKTRDKVVKGDVLINFTSEQLEFDKSQSLQRLHLLSAQLRQQAASHEDRRWNRLIRERHAAETIALKSIEDEIRQLIIYAPHDGIISELSPQLHVGRYISNEDRIMRLIAPHSQELIALPKDIDAARISDNAQFTFISNDASRDRVSGQLTVFSPTSEAYISETILTSIAGGPLAVNKDKNGRLIANRPVFKVRGQLHNKDPYLRVQRGIVKIKATPKSFASSLWQSFSRVLIRETDF